MQNIELIFSFSIVPWPGFYIYNVTKAVIKENLFRDVAPRSMIARIGSNPAHLKIETEILIDIFNYFKIWLRE